MIVAVKRNKKHKFIKIISIIALLVMFGAYYYHMNVTYSEKIKIELEENDKYSIMYRVHVQDIGWQDWRND